MFFNTFNYDDENRVRKLDILYSNLKLKERISYNNEKILVTHSF